MPPLVDLSSIPHSDPEIGLLLALLSNTTREWREYLGAVPPGLIVRQLHPNAHSIGALLLHIADVEGYWLHEAIEGQARPPEAVAALLSDETDQYNGLWPAPPAEPLEWYYALLDDVRAQTMLLAQTLLHADQVLTHPTRPDKTYTARWLLGHVIAHEAYHGGQAVLLSLMPAPPSAPPVPIIT